MESFPTVVFSQSPTPCKWALQGGKSPHYQAPFNPERPRIYNDISEAIGKTPMVRLNKIPKQEGLECEILVKCEFMNPGGSTKDRIGARMIQEFEREGKIHLGDTLLEATSGNTGVGASMVAAAKGYKMIITMPEKMSMEKEIVLKSLGAKVIRTPTKAAFDAPNSHINIAFRIEKENPNHYVLGQYTNPGNPLAHYDGTGEEIWYQTSGQLHAVVLTAGTGGTLTGIGRKLKERNKEIQIVGVDPIGSILAQPESLNTVQGTYQVEGIGYDFVPRVLDQSVADKWYKSSDQESFYYARKLISEEGLLVGGSSGGALAGAIRYCKEYNIGKGKTIVVFLPDSIRNYLSKFVNDSWMVDQKMMPAPKGPLDGLTIKDLLPTLQQGIVIQAQQTIQEIIQQLKQAKQEFAAVLKGTEIVGGISVKDLLFKLGTQRCVKTDSVENFVNLKARIVNQDYGLNELVHSIEVQNYVILEEQPSIVITPLDLASFSLEKL